MAYTTHTLREVIDHLTCSAGETDDFSTSHYGSGFIGAVESVPNKASVTSTRGTGPPNHTTCCIWMTVVVTQGTDIYMYNICKSEVDVYYMHTCTCWKINWVACNWKSSLITTNRSPNFYANLLCWWSLAATPNDSHILIDPCFPCYYCHITQFQCQSVAISNVKQLTLLK